MDIGIDIDVDPRIELPNLDRARNSSIAARGDIRVIVDSRNGPSWLLWCCRQASVKAGNPKAHAAFVGQRNVYRANNRDDGEKRCAKRLLGWPRWQ
jgi:hypothetical protein